MNVISKTSREGRWVLGSDYVVGIENFLYFINEDGRKFVEFSKGLTEKVTF